MPNIERSTNQKVVRGKVEKNFREESEISQAHKQVPDNPNRKTKGWTRDVYEFYQKNEY